MLFLDLKKGQDFWTEIIHFSTFQVIVQSLLQPDFWTITAAKNRLIRDVHLTIKGVSDEIWIYLLHIFMIYKFK